MDIIVYSLLNKKISTIATGISKVEYDESTSKIKVTYTTGDVIEYTIPTIKGRGIKNTVLNADYTLTITYDDDETYTTPSIRGPQGEQGIQGLPGKDGANSVEAGTGIQVDYDYDTKKYTISNTQTSAEWGNIEGNIEDQADLSGELDTLQLQITNLKNIGRFCAIWNANTGTPTSEPSTSPYAYKVGDYFRIGVAGYKVPTGATYVQGAYDTVTEETGIGDVWYYDGTQWVKQASSGGGTVQDVQVNGTSVLSGGIANIPYASTQNWGVLRTNESLGFKVNASGYANIVKSSDSEIEAKSNQYKPIVPANLQLAVDTGVKGSANYTSFTCEMADGTTKMLKFYNELV